MSLEARLSRLTMKGLRQREKQIDEAQGGGLSLGLGSWRAGDGLRGVGVG
jgi:hypothetical protein